MADPVTQDIPVALVPTGGQAFALTPNGRIPTSVLARTHVYQSYTPTWVSSGTAVAIGNATGTARYARVGKLVHAYGDIIFGSSSTYGTGTYTFALPVAAAAAAVASGPNAGSVYLVGTGFATAAAVLLSATTVGFFYGATYLGTLTQVGQLVPWTWASTNQIAWNLTYEAA